MPRPMHSLRLRLVLMFVAIFGTSQVLLGAAGLLMAEGRLRAQFDQELLRRTDGMIEQLVQSQRRWFPQPLPRVINEHTSSIFFRGFYVQLRDGEGQLIERSANLGGAELPFTTELVTAVNPYRLQNLRGAEVEAVAGGDAKLRMVTRWINEADMDPLILQVAADQRSQQAVIGLLRTLFVVAMPIGLFAASMASWWVTGRALREVRVVSDFAQQATPDKLGKQLPPPTHDDEIGQMVVHVNQMLQRLKAGFDAQEHFLQDASHELRTPLSSLLSEAQWLKQRHAVAAEEYRQFVVSVEQEVRHLSQVVGSLLLLTRTASRQATFHRQVTSLNDVVENAVEECRATADLGEVRLVLNLAMPDAEGEILVCGDAELLTIMVGNVIRNAIQVSPPGESVRVEVGARSDRAGILVRDHGPGVPPDAIDRIFDRFVQATTEGRRRGMGLGLAIAREVARLHHGEISVTNIDDGGAAFNMTLPLFRTRGASVETRPEGAASNVPG